MNWLRLLRPRGLFVKQAVSFFLVFSAVRFVAGVIDVRVSGARFERADPATTQAIRTTPRSAPRRRCGRNFSPDAFRSDGEGCSSDLGQERRD
ncbi:hypothetical protein GLE_0239 [Lysobacter enzymogenes]|uniref:Uncharacterized protein n=1 Tax=Lysobacter enzymogenes TaxID=69 RepID=A0A0S2DAS7_LYSEN|nr:hypothetical protein [Lysobacter enzymogenes]ALN55598.1 hypothetical protein GLE_0239 [Lysobacter enzymogenes]QCW24635.1 hypothetical protein FE772_02025 [Lysobacter enzymogenes]